MSELTWSEIPTLRRPLLLVALEGVYDAAEVATSSVRWIRDRNNAETVAEIDPERFYNFTEARPFIRLGDDGKRVIDWPNATVDVVKTEDSRDLVVMTGVEPHLRWSTFADHVVEIARRSGCEMVVTVGSMVAMVPHSRTFPVKGSTENPELVKRLGLNSPTYEGPTSLAGVLNERLERSGLPVISLRVEVPHYVPSAPNPKAMRLLLRRLQLTTGVTVNYEELDSDVDEWEQRVTEAVDSDEDSHDYVQRLESQYDNEQESLTTGEDLAAELEAFLQNQEIVVATDEMVFEDSPSVDPPDDSAGIDDGAEVEAETKDEPIAEDPAPSDPVVDDQND